MNRPADQWYKWISKVMLSLGVVLILSGIVFFFAYNWAVMSKFSKFLLVQTGIVGTFAMAAKKGSKTSSGQMYLFAASVLTGVLLAIYGQTYQTGADAFTLFLAWAFLISGWLVTGKNGAIWVLFTTLINVTYVTWYGQVIDSNGRNGISVFLLGFLILNLVILISREYLVIKDYKWLSNRITRWLTLSFLVCASTFYLLEKILNDYHRYTEAPLLVGATSLLSLAILGGALHVYRRKLPELFSLFMPVTAVCIITLAFIGKVLFDDAGKLSTMFSFSFITLFVAGTAIFYLQSVMKEIKKAKTGAEPIDTKTDGEPIREEAK